MVIKVISLGAKFMLRSATGTRPRKLLNLSSPFDEEHTIRASDLAEVNEPTSPPWGRRQTTSQKRSES
jgi:hypothetical protein